ncbi:hypothetical protein [Acetobacter musti]|uniref:hypothetical protein n=1 Tax=Acetobacter musti TaxID=864732 RepID=UPI0018E9AF81|nr:hypothetical protein [Acetobacter musti]
MLANIAIIIAGIITLDHYSIWPDLLAGLGIAFMNLDAAREIWAAARAGHRIATTETESAAPDPHQDL